MSPFLKLHLLAVTFWKFCRIGTAYGELKCLFLSGVQLPNLRFISRIFPFLCLWHKSATGTLQPGIFSLS